MTATGVFCSDSTEQFSIRRTQLLQRLSWLPRTGGWIGWAPGCHAGGSAVLEIIFLYSEDICPFKSSFWSDIWQIGPDIIYWLTTLWRREFKMCWWHVRSSCPIIMWNWPDIFKIWSDNVRWPTVISSTDTKFDSGSADQHSGSLNNWEESATFVTTCANG